MADLKEIKIFHGENANSILKYPHLRLEKEIF